MRRGVWKGEKGVLGERSRDCPALILMKFPMPLYPHFITVHHYCTASSNLQLIHLLQNVHAETTQFFNIPAGYTGQSAKIHTNINTPISSHQKKGKSLLQHFPGPDTFAYDLLKSY